MEDPNTLETTTLNKKRLYKRILAGSRDVRFSDFVALIEAFGFRLSRVTGSHHIFVREGMRELINLQIVDGKVKPYQIQQWLKLVERYNLSLENGT
jgi:predicted RNA binding protein YcfA (HicA-like mRNA interferase family)